MAEIIIGIDEAGRGPLAGPIVAAGVISRGLKKEKDILALVDDSKKLTPKKREDLFGPIVKNFVWSVRLLDNNFIDKYGIQAANVLLFHEIAEELLAQTKKSVADHDRSGRAEIVADYVGGADKLLRHIDFHKQGESKFGEIAAASIIAKVYRDRMMLGYDKDIPNYDFWLHKGYGTLQHFANIKKYGPSPIHRKSFLKSLDS